MKTVGEQSKSAQTSAGKTRMCHIRKAVVWHLVFRTTISVREIVSIVVAGGLGKQAEMILELMLT